MRVCLFVCLLACLFVCSFGCLFVCLFARLLVWLFAYLLVCLLVCLLFCSFACLFVCLLFCSFACLFVCLLARLFACLCAQVPRRLRGRPHASFSLFAAPPAARRAARRYVCAAWGCAGERAIRSSEATGYASQPRKEAPLPVINPVHACIRQTCDRQRAGVRACVRACGRAGGTSRRCAGKRRCDGAWGTRGMLEGC